MWCFMASPFTGQLSLSSYNYTAVEGSNITVTCTHLANAFVSLSGLSSTWVTTSFVSPYTDTVFTILNVSRVDSNKQFTCTQGGVSPSPPAQINVLCKLTKFFMITCVLNCYVFFKLSDFLITYNWYLY